MKIESLSIDHIASQFRQYLPRFIDEQTAPKRAGVAVILQSGPQGIEFFFIERSNRPEDPWSGHMAFPGGRYEPNADRDILATVIREVREETGVELLDSARLLGRADDVRAVGRGRVLPLAVSVMVYELLSPVAITLNDEAVAALWIPLAELLDPAHIKAKIYEFEGRKMELPALYVRGYVIWGLTLRMLLNICRILQLELPFDESLIPDPLRT